MKFLLTLMLALLVISSLVHAGYYLPSESCENTQQPPSGSYQKDCYNIVYIQTQVQGLEKGQEVCQLSAICPNQHNENIFPKILGTVGIFPEKCKDIKNENGTLKCVK